MKDITDIIANTILHIMEKHSTAKFFQVAGMVFDVRSEYKSGANTFHPNLMLFEIKAPPSGAEPVVIEHHFSIPEKFTELDDKKAASARPMWTIFQTDTGWIYKKQPALPVSDTQTAYFEFNSDFSCCRVYSDFLNPHTYEAGEFTSLTLFGCDQALISHLLATRNSILVHANALVYKDNGFLLAGPSGAGKTTLSTMLEKHGFQNIADDRIIITAEKNSPPVMHGSWFHGTTAMVSTAQHRLRSFFFLEHAHENSIIPIEDTRKKIGCLLQSVVRPCIQCHEWNRLLLTLDNLAGSVPCSYLKFDLSGNIINTIKNIFR